MSFHAPTPRGRQRRIPDHETRRQTPAKRRIYPHTHELQCHEYACPGYHTRAVPALRNKHTGRTQQLVGIRGNFRAQRSSEFFLLVSLLPDVLSCSHYNVYVISPVSIQCFFDRLYINDNLVLCHEHSSG